LKNVNTLILDSLYAKQEGKTPSERVAKELLRDVLLGTDNKGKAIIITTFSSHIARLKSIVDEGKKLKRKIVFLGRSLNRYIGAAQDAGLINFKNFEVVAYGAKIRKKLAVINKEGSDKYIIVCTGNQAEPGSMLVKMANGLLNFKFHKEDNVIFSCRTIPVEDNIKAREILEGKLRRLGCRLFKDIHVSVLPDTEVVVNSDVGMKIKKIEDIKENEKFKTLSFDPKDYKTKWLDARLIKHSYSGIIYDIQTKSGRKVSVTSGHSLFILKDNKVSSIKTDFLKNGDYLAISKSFTWRKVLDKIKIDKYLPQNKSKFSAIRMDRKWIYYANAKITKREIKLDNNFAKLLGYYLAEGSAPRHIALTFGLKEEKKVVNDIVPIIKKIFPCNVHVVRKDSSAEINFGANILKKIFKNWFGDNARTKRVPDFVFSASKEFKFNFLATYLDGDGHLDHGERFTRIRVKTASKKLASDLLYLFSQVGICAKFDHLQIDRRKKIAGNRRITKETIAYVIRIQGRNDLELLYPYLIGRIKEGVKRYFLESRKDRITYESQLIPLDKIDLNDIDAKKDSYLSDIILNNDKKKKPSKYVTRSVLKRDSLSIRGNLKKLLDGGLLFDPVTKIEKREYSGEVFDFEVPGTQNFLGGFGGIFLHNSGHSYIEDDRELIKILKPKKIVPAHGGRDVTLPAEDLARDMGYKHGKSIFILRNGQSVKLE